MQFGIHRSVEMLLRLYNWLYNRLYRANTALIFRPCISPCFVGVSIEVKFIENAYTEDSGIGYFCK